MTQRNEKDLVKARKEFYERATIQLDLVKMGETAGNDDKNDNTYQDIKLFSAKKVVPLVILTFTMIYWTYGLSHYFDNQYA